MSGYDAADGDDVRTDERTSAPKPPASPEREAESLRAELADVLNADTADAVERAEALTARIETILDSRAS